MDKILVTGANGFIGQSLCEELVKRKKKVRAVVRNTSDFKNYNNNIEYLSVGNINSQTNWIKLLSNIDCVIHCAGLNHAKKKRQFKCERFF